MTADCFKPQINTDKNGSKQLMHLSVLIRVHLGRKSSVRGALNQLRKRNRQAIRIKRYR